MRTLYHFWLSPGARKVRLILKEKNLEFELKIERSWERRPEFLALNPAGETPVLVEADGTVLADSAAPDGWSAGSMASSMSRSPRIWSKRK